VRNLLYKYNWAYFWGKDWVSKRDAAVIALQTIDGVYGADEQFEFKIMNKSDINNMCKKIGLFNEKSQWVKQVYFFETGKYYDNMDDLKKDMLILSLGIC